ncbi:MAG: FtsX-like permease family protein [Candidatus Taylorbacteria bacterium]
MFSILNTRIGLFLAVRQIKRSSIWTTSLIIFVMILTFLNLVVVSGILVGLIQGAVDSIREHYTSDIIISTLNNKTYIENSPNVLNILKSLPQVENVSSRYLKGGTIEANYKTRTNTNDKPNIAATNIVGIDPIAEDKITGLSKFMIEGSYLEPGDYDKILLGAYLNKKYLPIDNPGFTALNDVGPGTKVRLNINGIQREVTIKGIIKAKVDEVSMRAFMVDSQFRSLIGRNDYNVSEIVAQLKPGSDPNLVRDTLIQSGVGHFAKVQTFADAEPKFIKDMIDTFALLGNLLSSIGLVVASITIFIVIFINAITRRKFIGILKGIGISGEAIEMSYIFQSIFYAITGSVVGVALVYLVLEPLIRAYPIDFPFSDGILVAPLTGTLLRMALLIVATIVAGYIPARMIVRKNTLDSILGRK